MAIILTAFTPVITRVPWVKPPDLQRVFTAQPRARLDFTVRDGVVPLKPINDDQNNQIVCLLPQTFAYRMISATCAIRQNSANDYDAFAQMQVTNAMRAHQLGLTVRHPMPSGISSSFSPVTPERIWFADSLQGMPTYIMQSIQVNVAAGVDFRFSNTIDPASGAGVINFFASFWEFDIEQVQMFPPLVPQALTYSL